MRLEHTPRPEHNLHVSTRLITSSTILQYSADELDRAVNQEQTENPVLEVLEQRVCHFCGTRLYGATCAVCGHFAPSTQATSMQESLSAYQFSNTQEPLWEYQQQVSYDIDNYGFAEADSDDAYDPMARIAMGETLAETLLHQLEALVTPDDAPIAEQLVGNLNERGYLEISVEEIARQLQLPTERVTYVLSQLHTLEPLGIGARNLRECLLIQLDAISELAPAHPLTRPLIENYLERLGRNQLAEIARELKQAEQEVRQAALYIRSMLHPFPAHIYWTDYPAKRNGDATYVRPDIFIRKNENGFEIELIEERRYNFRIDSTGPTEQPRQSSSSTATEERRYMHHYTDRARFFVECIQRRWRTLRRVTEVVVDYQHDFLERGIRYLRPLTRAEVAARLNLDEGTVSRATANKYALLPNGRLIPLSDFFDGSLGIKDMIRELLHHEHPRHRLSDDEIARTLTEQGYPMARRTVTKYREEMGIGSSRERS